MQQYYVLLGLAPNATADDIKKAYRRLAKQHHPDIVGNSPQAIQYFQEIGQAYEYLMAYLQRSAYQAPPYYPPAYQPPPPAQDFKSYTWEPMKAETAPPPSPKKEPPPPKPEPEPEPEIPFVSIIPQEMLLATRLEASQEALRRISQDKGDEKAKLEWEVKLFLKEDYSVERSPKTGGFSVTSNKSGKKVNVRSATKSPGLSGFFKGHL